MSAPRSLALGACALALASATGCGVPASTLKTKRPDVLTRANQVCANSTQRGRMFVGGMRAPANRNQLAALVNEDGAVNQDAVTALEYLQPSDSRKRAFEEFLDAETLVQDQGGPIVDAVNRGDQAGMAGAVRVIVHQSRRAAKAARAYGLPPCPWTLPSAMLAARPAQGARPSALLTTWHRMARALAALHR